jgi:hypothetical protein
MALAAKSAKTVKITPPATANPTSKASDSKGWRLDDEGPNIGVYYFVNLRFANTKSGKNNILNVANVG